MTLLDDPDFVRATTLDEFMHFVMYAANLPAKFQANLMESMYHALQNKRSKAEYHAFKCFYDFYSSKHNRTLGDALEFLEDNVPSDVKKIREKLKDHKKDTDSEKFYQTFARVWFRRRIGLNLVKLVHYGPDYVQDAPSTPPTLPFKNSIYDYILYNVCVLPVFAIYDNSHYTKLMKEPINSSLERMGIPLCDESQSKIVLPDFLYLDPLKKLVEFYFTNEASVGNVARLAFQELADQIKTKSESENASED